MKCAFTLQRMLRTYLLILGFTSYFFLGLSPRLFAAPNQNQNPSLVQPPAPRLAAPANDDTDAEDPTASAISDALNSATYDPVRTPRADYLIQNQDQLLREVSEIAQKLEELAEIKRAQVGDEAFMEDLISGDSQARVQVSVDGIGEARLTSVDGKMVTRVIHKIGIIFIIFNPDEVSENSEHLKKLVDRNLLYAKDKGMDVFLVQAKSTQFQGDPGTAYTLIKKPHFWQARFWNSFWGAVWTPPQKGDYLVVGTFCGLLQFGAAGCLSAVKLGLEGNGWGADTWLRGFTSPPAVLSGIWGTTIGAFSGFYRNLTNQGTHRSRILKAAVNSVLFNYTLNILQNHGGIHQLLLTDLTSLTLHASLLANVFVQQLGRDSWNVFPRIWEDMRQKKQLKPHVIKIPNPFGNNIEIKVNHMSLIYGAWTFLPFSLKILDLVPVFHAYIPILGVKNIGSILFYISPIVMAYAATKYAEFKKYYKAGEIRARWENIKKLGFIRNPAAKIYYYTRAAAALLWEGARKKLGLPVPEEEARTGESVPLEQESASVPAVFPLSFQDDFCRSLFAY